MNLEKKLILTGRHNTCITIKEELENVPMFWNIICVLAERQHGSYLNRNIWKNGRYFYICGTAHPNAGHPFFTHQQFSILMTLLAKWRTPVLLRTPISSLTTAAFYIYHAATQMRDTRSSLIVYFIFYQQFSIFMTLLAICRRPVLLRMFFSSVTSHNSSFLHLPRC